MPVCELCRREGGGITTHHLIPRTRRKRKKTKQDVTREGVKSRPVDLCRLCHKRVHRLTHKEAEQYF